MSVGTPTHAVAERDAAAHHGGDEAECGGGDAVGHARVDVDVVAGEVAGLLHLQAVLGDDALKAETQGHWSANRLTGTRVMVDSHWQYSARLL